MLIHTFINYEALRITEKIDNNIYFNWDISLYKQRLWSTRYNLIFTFAWSFKRLQKHEKILDPCGILTT